MLTAVSLKRIQNKTNDTTCSHRISHAAQGNDRDKKKDEMAAITSASTSDSELPPFDGPYCGWLRLGATTVGVDVDFAVKLLDASKLVAGGTTLEVEYTVIGSVPMPETVGWSGIETYAVAAAPPRLVGATATVTGFGDYDLGNPYTLIDEIPPSSRNFSGSGWERGYWFSYSKGYSFARKNDSWSGGRSDNRVAFPGMPSDSDGMPSRKGMGGDWDNMNFTVHHSDSSANTAPRFYLTGTGLRPSNPACVDVELIIANTEPRGIEIVREGPDKLCYFNCGLSHDFVLSRDKSGDIVSEAIFRTLNTEENGRLADDDLGRGLALLGIDGDDTPSSLRLNEFQELCSRRSAAGAFDILEAVCSLQRDGAGTGKSGIALFDWENGELNESFKYIDSNGSGTVDGPEEMGKLLFYAGIGNAGSTKMASAIYSLFDADGDHALNLEEVRAMLRWVKGASIILYLELWRSTVPYRSRTTGLFERNMSDALPKAQELMAKYEAEKYGRLFPHLLAAANALDADQSYSYGLSTAEFEALLKGAPNKKMQALRDTLMCEGAVPWKANEGVNAGDTSGDGVVDALQIPRALPGHTLENLDELDWRVVRDNFADYFYGIELFWDRDQPGPHQSIYGRACNDDAEYLPIAVRIVARCLLALPPAFLARKEALKTIYLVDALAVGNPAHGVSGVASGTTIWLSARSSHRVHVYHKYGAFFHELYHCIDRNDNSVNPDPEDQSWRALNATGFKYAAELTPPESGGCAMQGNGACTQGFASDYGATNPREDKATVFELWMTRRPLALARIAAMYEVKEMFVDGTFNEKYKSMNYVTRPISARGPDKVLEAKVTRLIEEVVRFAPEMADVLKISPEHRVARPHVPEVGDPVLCKYPKFRGKLDDPWFMGTVAAIHVDSATIRYEDGNEASGVLAEELYYCPQGPFDTTIGKSVRCNDVEVVVARGNLGRLQPVTFSAAAAATPTATVTGFGDYDLGNPYTLIDEIPPSSRNFSGSGWERGYWFSYSKGYSFARKNDSWSGGRSDNRVAFPGMPSDSDGMPSRKGMGGDWDNMNFTVHHSEEKVL